MPTLLTNLKARSSLRPQHCHAGLPLFEEKDLLVSLLTWVPLCAPPHEPEQPDRSVQLAGGPISDAYCHFPGFVLYIVVP